MGNAQYAIGDPFDVTPANLLSNGDFTEGLGVTTWTATNCATARVASGGPITDSPYVMQATANGVGDASISTTISSMEHKKLKRFCYSVWVKFSSATGNIDLALNEVGGTNPAAAISGSGNSQPIASASTWYHLTGSGVMAYNDRTSVTLTISRSGATNGQVLLVSRARVWCINSSGGEGVDGGDFLVPVDHIARGDTIAAQLTCEAGYPASNASVSVFGRTTRLPYNETITNGALWFDFGYTVHPDYVFVEGLNTSKVRLVYADEDELSSNGIIEQAVADVSENPFTGRRSRLLANSLSGYHRFWGLRFTQSYTPPVKGGDYFYEIARVSWIKESGLHTMIQNWGTPYRTQTNQLVVSGRYAGGLTFDKTLCPVYMSFTLQQDFVMNRGDGVDTDIGAFVSMQRSQRVLHFENKASGDTNNCRAYVCRQSGIAGVDYGAWPVASVSIGLEEIS